MQKSEQILEENQSITLKAHTKALILQTISLLPDADINLAKLEVLCVELIFSVY